MRNKAILLRDFTISYNNFSYLKKLIFTSLMIGIGVILKLIEIPTFSSFLKLDLALIPALIIVFMRGNWYAFFAAFIIDLLSLRGNIFGWFASVMFSLSIVNGTNLFFELCLKRFKNHYWSFLFALFFSGSISSLFLIVLNTYFITPAFFVLSYEEISSPAIWSNFSSLFFGIENYNDAMFLFYGAFNFLIKVPTLIVLMGLLVLSFFYVRKKGVLSKRKSIKIKKYENARND